MVADRQPERGEMVRFEAARQAVRAVASAFRTLRLYPLSHARTVEALEAARAAVEAYTAVYGVMGVTTSAQGLVFDFPARPYDDDVVADLARTLRARAVPALRFLHGISSAELGEFVAALHLPRPQIDRAGGLRAHLSTRGVRNLVLETVGETRAPGAGPIESLVDAVEAGDSDRIAAYLQQVDAEDEALRQLFRTIDRRLVSQSRQQQLRAWKAIGQSLAPPRAPGLRAICAAIVRAVDEPWAATLIAQWPPVAVASLEAYSGEGAEATGRRIGDVLRSVRRPIPAAALPAVTEPSPSEVHGAAEAFASWDARRLREQAVRAWGELLPQAGGADLTAMLAELETAVVSMVQEDDIGGILAAVEVLSAAGSRSDAPSEAARTMLARVLSLSARPLLEHLTADPSDPGHPFVQAMRSAPGETVRVLLEISAEDTRIQIRRRTVDLLAALAAGRPELLTPHVMDSRWYVARNAVTVLERVGGEGTMPALRAAMVHGDGHVRREALRAAAAVGTVDAMEAMAEALYHPDAETRQAAAHWLGVMGRPEAAAVLVAILEGGSLLDQVDLKREVIRALGRIGTPACAQALRRVATAAGPLLRRRAVEELKQEAAAALARMGESAT